MDAEAEPRRLRDILHQLHARAVIADAVDVEARVGLRDVRRNAVDQAVRTALGAVDEFEGAIGIGAGEGAEMVGDRVEVAVVPVPDRAQHPVRVQVKGVGAAAHLRRQQGDPLAEAAAADIGGRIRHLADDALLLRAVAAARAGTLAARAADRRIAQRRGLTGHGRAGDDLQRIAPAEREFLPGQWRGDGCDLARLLIEIDLELPVILLGDLDLSLEVSLDLRFRGERLRCQLDLRIRGGFILGDGLSLRPRHGFSPPFVCGPRIDMKRAIRGLN